jgi:dihydroxyacid dehydratase/phosphogluconate dehydratase
LVRTARPRRIHRSWTKNRGIPHDQFDGRPVIGICNTWSELTPCNTHFRVLTEQVRQGVLEARGFPLEFPVMSLGETLMRPTTMLFRNLVSMDVEESLRANPLDGVVLLMGCDKTTPALLMGAASVDLPTIGVSGGPMLSGKFRGGELGSGTAEELRAARLSGHGRGRQYAAAGQDSSPGRDRHGVHLGCAHERAPYGTVVLHSAPEAATGGPLALVHDGDMIELDVDRRRLHLDVSEDELARRREAWKPPPAPATRGYTKLYFDHVLQADRGADLDFLVGKSGSAVAKDNH